MSLLTQLAQRRSIRQYEDTPVEKEAIVQILQGARLAPSWKNKQCWRFLVIDNRELIEKIGQLVRFNPSQNAYEKAPYLLFACADPERSGLRDGKPYYLADTAIALEHAMLTAQSLGLGTCWVGVFPEDELKALLNVPENLRIIAFTPIGHPAETPDARPRLELSQMAFRNTFDTPFE